MTVLELVLSTRDDIEDPHGKNVRERNYKSFGFIAFVPGHVRLRRECSPCHLGMT